MRRAGSLAVFPRWLGCLLLSGFCAMSSGCAIAEFGQMVTDSTVKLFKPTHRDYTDETDQKIDEWSTVGDEGRGERPKDHESDALTRYMSSPKAQGIERNLGVD